MSAVVHTSAPTAAPRKTIAQLRAERTRAAVATTVASHQNIFKALERDPEQPNVLRFQMAPTHVTYANTLRRAMITEVETVGFRADIAADGSTTDVKISRNDTPMSNEMLAHRIGLIPIHFATPLEWDPSKYTFKLDITNDRAEPRDVVAADIQVLMDRGPEEDPLPVPSVQFFHPDPVTHDTALLAVLKGRVGTQEPESITFSAKATLGTGRENARFMPVTSRCAYGYTQDDDPEHRKELFNHWLTNSKKVTPTELDTDTVRKGELEREFATMEIQRCYKVDERGEPYSFDFIVESAGVLDSTYIVARAIDVLQAKLLRYASIDRGDLPEGLRVLPADARLKGFDFIFTAEDHTLGNLLQTWMEQNLIDSGEITFAGYKVPHPLRDEMVVRVGVESGKDVDARAAIAKAARECAQMFKNWAVMWQTAV